MKRIIIGVLALAALASASVVAQASRGPDRSGAAQKPALLKRVNVAASEFKFVLNSKTANRGVVIFKVTNVGKVEHDFQIKGRKTKLLSHGKSATLRVTFVRKGTYPYKCTVPGHAAGGMKGVFTIT